MAASNRIIALNLGMQTIGFAEFRSTSGGGLLLTGFRLMEISPDPATDGTRIAQIRLALDEVISGAKVKGANARVAVAAQSVFSRFVKLPSVGEGKIEQIIQYEAQQNVPFPLNEVVWDHQIVGDPSGGKIEVVLAAVKTDLIEEVVDAIQGVGLHPSTIDIAPMALYNAFRYSYSDIEGCTLLIDVGARTTNLVFAEPGKVFNRSIPVGGSALTAAIAKDFEEPLVAAEERKRSIGMIGLGGTYAEPSDPDIARVSKVARNTMTRLHSEISRSISFYRSQQGGASPERACLCGGATSLPYTREFFSEKLRMPVEFFNPLRNVSVAPTVDVAAASGSAHVMGELVGLALRGAMDCPMELNLRPDSVITAEKSARRLPSFAVTVACLLVGLTGWWLYFHQAEKVMHQVLDSLQPKIASLQQFEKKIQSAKKDLEAVRAVATPLVEATQDREYFVSLIEEINLRMPEEFIWVTLLEPMQIEAGAPDQKAPKGATPTPSRKTDGITSIAGRTAGIRLKGLYLDNPNQAKVVDEFARRLGESPLVESVTTAGRTVPKDTDWAYDFELHLKLRKGMSR
jgi:type IV pilus assembly protein PilM